MFAQTPEGGRRLTIAVTYALFATGSVLALGTQQRLWPGAARISLLVGGIVVTLLWLLWWTAVRPYWRGGPFDAQIYLYVRVVLLFVLTVINPFFAVAAFIGYIDADELPSRRQATVMVAATALILAGSQSGGLPPRSVGQAIVAVGLFGLNFGLATVFLHQALKQNALSESRVVMISTLEDTNRRLEDAMAENAALQRQLLVQAREAGVQDERQRLAREIHDTIAQGLAGIVTQLQAARSAPADASDHVDRAAQLARDSLDEARRSVRALGPRELTDDALPDAVRALVAQWSADTGVPAVLQTTGPVRPLHEEIEATLLRITQESLTNIARHAAATRVGVTLSYMNDEVTLDVRDDGRGFSADAALPAPDGVDDRSSGFGIPGMRLRAMRVSGALEVESEPDGGTAISVRVPAIGRENGTDGCDD